MALVRVPIHRVGNRPNLFLGCDREMAMFSALLSAILILAAQDWIALFVGIILWFTSIWALRLMAKSDPQMRLIYLRQRRYKAYYPARSTPSRVNTHIQESQYR